MKIPKHILSHFDHAWNLARWVFRICISLELDELCFFFLLWTFGSIREGAEWQLPFGITKILLIFVCIRCKLKHFWHIQTSFHLSDISIADQSRTNVFNAVNLVLNQPFPLQFHDCGYFVRKCTYRYVRAWPRDSFGLANYL